MNRITVPNCLTFARLVGAILLIFTQPLSLIFYIIFTLCGLTDALDGPIARATNTESEFGARLDSVSDLTFYVVLMLKILPNLRKILPVWVWYLVAFIIFFRVVIYVTVALKYKCFASLHTYLNKISGFSIFLIPYFLGSGVNVAYCKFVCALALIAAIEEFVVHLVRKEYDPSVQSIFQINKNENVA